MQQGREQLRDWMKRRGVNQREAAILLGLNEVHFSQILNGHRQPGLANAVRIEQRTGISVESWALNEISEPAEVVALNSRKRRISKA